MRVDGNLHDKEDYCHNITYDPVNEEEICGKLKLHKLECQRENYQWLSPTLEYYWQHGTGSKRSAFLEQTGFVYSYRLV